ncbi:hypothetical protein LTR96_006259 [Exophiala xenobiotica]|nr:hypothetical protein LTR72_007610 [Exophiala xenobiotica]KAK5268552.1 hypothetical protein LTR96_006259 [Exophiala xenobiotica]KAK5292896.1 hypothetical protein LTR14_005245 [Exophiala xenobiotica]KAK5336745.1 hypothetical protein LTR98_007051 [Exophiala xenobiotica]KAK5484498.1 hypothetical protein LTR55_005994 [Exophiala xenobiotica]
MPSPPKARPIKPAREGQPLKPTAAKKRQTSARISAACEACKKRKTKCTGGPPPCQLCENLGTECVIDLSLDMRRRAALQRTIDESRSYQETLNQLMDSIREGPSPRLNSLYDIIKSGGSNQDTAAAIQHYLRDSDEQGSEQSKLSNGDIIESPPPDEAGEGMILDDDSGSASASSLKREEVDGQKMSPPSRGGSVPLQLQTAKQKHRSETPNFESLLSALKSCSISEGEELLRRFVASEIADKGSASPWSAASGRSLVEKGTPMIVQAGMAERSKWHPALQLRSPTVSVEEKLQKTGQGNQRRFSEAGASTVRQEQSKLRSQPVSPRPPFPQLPPQQINTDIPMLSMQQQISPTAPYLELASTPESSTSAPNGWDLSVAQENQSTRLRIPRHLVLPLIIPDDSYMSRTYTHYLQGARQMLETGVPWSNVLGVGDEVAVDLFFRSRTERDPFECSSWACEVSRSYETDVFARLGTAYMLTFMMRWLLVPTVENYRKVPEMMKPTPSQCMIPHIGAIETIPIPSVRDATVHHLRDWLTPLINCNWSVNWHHGMDAAVQRSPNTGATVLTSKFIHHVTDYDNWSVGSTFLETFPEVIGKIRIHD